MTPDANEFEFIEDGGRTPIVRGEDVCFVRLPCGITRKRKLLASLASALHFPDYFGHNWDAFEECMADLSWFGEAKTICLLHADLPCANNVKTLAVYLDILQKRVQAETKKNVVKLRVYFPASTRVAVQSILTSDND